MAFYYLNWKLKDCSLFYRDVRLWTLSWFSIMGFGSTLTYGIDVISLDILECNAAHTNTHREIHVRSTAQMFMFMFSSLVFGKHVLWDKFAKYLYYCQSDYSLPIEWALVMVCRFNVIQLKNFRNQKRMWNDITTWSVSKCEILFGIHFFKNSFIVGMIELWNDSTNIHLTLQRERWNSWISTWHFSGCENSDLSIISVTIVWVKVKGKGKGKRKGVVSP